jgi:ribosomal protein S18 acetylase RimI-like enzyme
MLSEADLTLVEACEERIVNCWPAVDTMLINGFVVRFANGYSGRANSASPLRRDSTLGDDEIEIIQKYYNLNALKPCFRATILMHPTMKSRLFARGYRVKDSSFGMIADLPQLDASAPSNAAIRIETAPSRAWLEGVSALQKPEKRDPAHLAAILRRLKVQAFFVSLQQDGRDVGFGYCAIDRGMAEIASIILAPEARGRGLGREIVENLLTLAQKAGAKQAFLQVEQNNAVALKLYESLNFRRLYSYDTLVLEG